MIALSSSVQELHHHVRLRGEFRSPTVVVTVHGEVEWDMHNVSPGDIQSLCSCDIRCLRALGLLVIRAVVLMCHQPLCFTHQCRPVCLSPYAGMLLNQIIFIPSIQIPVRYKEEVLMFEGTTLTIAEDMLCVMDPVKRMKSRKLREKISSSTPKMLLITTNWTPRTT